MALEPISFAVGVVGLVGAFTACLDCFEYIRIGRHLGEDYQTSLIKLDFLRLRLTRWGEVVGLINASEHEAETRLKASLAHPDQEYEGVTHALGEILRLFERAAKASKKMERMTPTMELGDGEANVELTYIHSLHIKMRELAIKRQKRSSLLRKTTWALYGRKNFDRLITDLHDLITGLEDLVPNQPQHQLCETEVSEIAADEDLALLDNILEEPVDDENNSLDNFLRDALSKAIDERRGSETTATWKRSKAGAGSKIQQGNNIASNYKGQFLNDKASYTVEDSEFGQNVEIHQGHRLVVGSIKYRSFMNVIP